MIDASLNDADNKTETATEKGGKRENETTRKYLRYLKLERNYTANTVEAYRNDLAHLERYMKREGLTPETVRREHLEHFAATLHEHGIGPSSQARILSGVRSFFKYLQMEGYISDDPSELLEWPHLGEHLPEVLTTEEIDRMEAAIDLSKPEGQRNKAIIEVLFSCGLRVSELTALKLSDLFMSDNFVRIKGKGRKERLVPISAKAVKELKLWFIDRDRMERLKAEGVKRKLVGFKLIDRGIPRHGYAIAAPDGTEIGHVTSGTMSPCLKVGVALGYVEAAYAKPGTEIAVVIREKPVKAEVVKIPFV